MNGSRMKLGKKSKSSKKELKMNTQHSKTYGTLQSSPEREIYSDTGLPKKDRKISNKQPNPMRTGETTTNKAQNEQKEGIIKIRAELNDIETKRTF